MFMQMKAGNDSSSSHVLEIGTKVCKKGIIFLDLARNNVLWSGLVAPQAL